MDRLWKMSGWLAREARFLDTNLELFKQFCMKLLELGVLLDRSWLHIRALHPQYAGMARLWTRETGIEERYLDHGFEETRTYLTSPVRLHCPGAKHIGLESCRARWPDVAMPSVSADRAARPVPRTGRAQVRLARSVNGGLSEPDKASEMW
jgi:hypothetical protein